MRRFCLALLSCVIAIAVNAASDIKESPVVITPTGKIRGSVMTSRLGKSIYAFRGVRYAESPSGSRRFKQAVPVLPWNDVFDASEEGPSCPQPNDNTTSEDCLRLNIYTTKLPSTNQRNNCHGTKRPVMFFIHGGASALASGQSTLNGPAYLMDQDIVLVTINYRLGSLGCLSTGDSFAPGNLGLKDQVEALRWVRKNVAVFGGNPNSVTIFGDSSGAASVSMHVVSPMSRGLFHKAIAMSGTAVFPEPLPLHQKHLAEKQAALLGCPTDSSRRILDCLMTKSAQELGDSTEQFFDKEFGAVVWMPVVEPEVPGVERFLPAQPVDLIRTGMFHQVPLIVGITEEEFGGMVVRLTEAWKAGNTTTLQKLDRNWEKLAPLICSYESGTARSRQISRELRRFYFKDHPINIEVAEELSHIPADCIIGIAAHHFANLIAENSKKSVYYYKFSFRGRYSHATWKDTGKPYGGAVHMDDLQYLFNIGYFPFFERNDHEIPMVERLTSMWANFAKTGYPIPENDKLFEGVQWERFTVKNKKYLEIGDDLTMKTGLYSERMEIWDRLFPGKTSHISVKA